MSVTSESIFNLIPKAQKLPEKKDIYRSKYDPKAPLTGSTFGLHGTTVTVGKGINDELKKVCFRWTKSQLFIETLFTCLIFIFPYRHGLLAALLGQNQKKQILPIFFVEVVKNKTQNNLKTFNEVLQ